MIRKAIREEYPQLLTIQTTCIRGLTDTYSQYETEAWIDYLNQEGIDRYATYENQVFEDGKGDIAGFVSWLQRGSHANIECLYVLSSFRDQGIGRLLLEEAEMDLVAGMIVHVRSTVNAISFYERLGYAQIGEAVSRAGFSIGVLEKIVLP